MSTTTKNWRRVTRSRRCPICEHQDWCLYIGSDNDVSAVICARTESLKRCGEAGWLHVLQNDTSFQPRRRTIPAAPHPPKCDLSFHSLSQECVAAALPSAVEQLAAKLGVSVAALRRLDVGWSDKHFAWTFPMCNPSGSPVGIRLRSHGGFKWSIKGGHDGIFIPHELLVGERLLICEGPTDTAALLDLQFNVVGRPSCVGGVKHLVDYVRLWCERDVVIVADADSHGAGQRGAEILADSLAPYCPAIRTITPPAGIKDARDWKRSGAGHADIVAAIDATPVRRLNVTRAG